jgi:hypothetical protein
MSATSWTRRLLVLGLRALLIAGCVVALLLSQDAGAETQQTGTSLSNPTTSTGQADQTTKITPEQEAALVEVRKILREASEMAQSVVIENPESKEGKFLVNNKRFVLWDIVGAKARAGDIDGARLMATANGVGGVAIGIALAKAGRPYEGLDELASLELDPPTRFVFVEALMKAGDRQTALEVAESRGTYLWQAPSIAYLANLQAKAGDVEYKKTFQRALKVAEAFDKLDKHTSDANIGKYKALVHIARAQADAGDVTESRQTFVKALETALVVPERDQFNALLISAEAQARSGDQLGSERTFGQAIIAAKKLAPNQQLSESKRIAETQLEVGNRTAATETVRHLLQVPSGSSPYEQADGLMKQARWHLIFGDRAAAKGALQTVAPQVRTIADGFATTKLEKGDIYYDSPELGKSNIYHSLAQLAAECELYEMAQEAVRAITSDQTKANAIRHIVTGLLPTSERPEVQQVMQTLAKDATSLTGILSFPRDLTLMDVAVTQAAAGDVKTAVRIADRVAEVLRDNTYRHMVAALIEKRDWTGGQEVLSRMKARWMLDESSHHMFRALAKAQAKAGMEKQVIEWSHKQPDSMARANVFLGVAEGLMERAGIEQLRPVVPL